MAAVTVSCNYSYFLLQVHVTMAFVAVSDNHSICCHNNATVAVPCDHGYCCSSMLPWLLVQFYVTMVTGAVYVLRVF